MLYRPITDELLTGPDILDKYGVSCENYVLARCLEGDRSDNIPGIGGVGFKTAIKRFPFLSEPKRYLVDNLIQFSEEQAKAKGSSKIYDKVLSSEETLFLNYNLMQLIVPQINMATSLEIEQTIENAELYFNKTMLLKKMIGDGFGELMLEGLFACFRRMVKEHKENYEG